MLYGRAAFALTLLLPVSGAVPGASRAQEPVGYVAQVHGRWRLIGAPVDSLTEGQLVPPGGILRPPARYSRADHISVALRTGVRLDHDCAVEWECDSDLRLPELPGSVETPLGRVVSAVMSILPKRPQRYQPLISRSTRLSPAVLLLEGGRLDLSPLLRGAPAGSHRFEVRRIADGTQLEQEPLIESLDVDWKVETPATVPVSEVRAGLYRIVQIRPGFGEAWILVQGPERYHAAAARFGDAARATAAWTAEVGDRPREALLRAYLEHLAREGSP